MPTSIILFLSSPDQFSEGVGILDNILEAVTILKSPVEEVFNDVSLKTEACGQ